MQGLSAIRPSFVCHTVTIDVEIAPVMLLTLEEDGLLVQQ